MEKFVQVPREMLLNCSISLQARGLYAIIRALPLNWECSVRALTEYTGMSKDTISKYLRELEAYGYLERHQVCDENGQFYGMEYELKER